MFCCYLLQFQGREHGGPRVGYRDVVQQIIQRQGLKGFYSGIIPEYCKVVPGVAIAFCTYEEMKRLLYAF